MDYIAKIKIAGGALVGLLLLWLIWKFFFGLFKHLIIALAIGLAGAGAYYYLRVSPPTRNSAIGKYAYLKDGGKYLGVIEAEGEDNQRGDVWVVRPPGRYPVMYAKSRVAIKEKLDPNAPGDFDPTPLPAASPVKAVKSRKGSSGPR